MITPEQYQKIEAFLLHRMEPAEEQAFLDEVARDEDLRNELLFELKMKELGPEESAGYLPADTGSKAYAEAVSLVNDAIAAAERNTGGKQASTTARRSLRRAWNMAAIIIGVLVAVGVALVIISRKKDPPVIVKQPQHHVNDTAQNPALDTGIRDIQLAVTRKAFQDFYKRYEDLGDKPPKLGIMIAQYEARHDELALAMAKEISISMGSGDANARLKGCRSFYQGLCHMGLGDTTGIAVKDFNDALACKNQLKDILPDIYWYLALAHLQKNDAEGALNSLQLLRSNDPASKYRRQAAELAGRLKK